MKNEQGISLIVLVITIIIIIILAGSVILSLASNNPISSASEASFKETVKSFNSELDLYYSTQYATTLGTFNPNLLNADSTSATYNGAAIAGTPNIYSIVPSINSSTEYSDKFVIRNGKLLYKGTETDKQDWAEQVYLENINRPNLTLTPNVSGNYMHLEWNTHDSSQPFSYKVYQQKNGTGEFQSISTSNLRDKVKVLNIYPSVSTMITFTNWKGETFTLPKSASIKSWMEVPNAENSKGYGMGLIDVDCVTTTQFNSNPQSYLYDANGKYKYDVVFQGVWDSNNSEYLNASALQEINKYTINGHGFLQGHDLSVVNDKIFGGGTNSNTVGSSRVKIAKRGLLMEYPWSIGDIGTLLNVPYSHNWGLYSSSDIWLKYVDYQDPLYGTNPSWRGPHFEDSKGSTDHFLVTKNNYAMIQTGHSNGNATTDEQKIIANTLFYLAQLTGDTFLDDHSGQDLKAPTAPVISSAIINGATGKVDISFTVSIDLGSVYSYYVEAIGQNSDVTLKSGTKTTTITSGLSGYSIVVDNSPTTVPGNTVNLTMNNTSITKPAGTDVYVHIKAIDNGGNVSNTVHLKAS